MFPSETRGQMDPWRGDTVVHPPPGQASGPQAIGSTQGNYWWQLVVSYLRKQFSVSMYVCPSIPFFPLCVRPIVTFSPKKCLHNVLIF